MCLPVAAIAGIAMGAGSLLGAAGQISAGNYTKAAADANARNLNAAANDAINRGDVEQQNVGAQYAQLTGKQRAAFGASGIEGSSGSALDILASTAGLSAQDQLTVRNNAAREAWGYRSQAQDVRNQGKLAKRQGLFGAGSTLLTGAGSIIPMFGK